MAMVTAARRYAYTKWLLPILFVSTCWMSATAEETLPHTDQGYQAATISELNFFGGPYLGGNQDGFLGGADIHVGAPLSDQLGLQFGGVPAFVDGRFIGSLEAHLFTRSPEIGGFGFYGSVTRWNGWGGSDIPTIYTEVFDKNSSLYRLGVEGEYYLDNWTLSGVAGWKNSGKSNLFAEARLSYYPTDFTKIYIGYEFTDRWLSDQSYELRDTGGALVETGSFKSPSLHVAKLGVEHILPFNVSSSLAGTSMYAEAQVGESGYFGGAVGLKMRFTDPARTATISGPISISTGTTIGGDRGPSLKERDRSDYFPTWIPRDARKGSHAKRSQNAPVAGPICTPSGNSCDFANPGACCSVVCMASMAGPVCL